MAQDVNGLIQMSRGLFIIHKTISDVLLSGSGILGRFCWVPLTLRRLRSKYWPEQWSPPGSVWGEATPSSLSRLSACLRDINSLPHGPLHRESFMMWKLESFRKLISKVTSHGFYCSPFRSESPGPA